MLKCGGASYETCGNQQAKDEFDKAYYSAAEDIELALREVDEAQSAEDAESAALEGLFAERGDIVEALRVARTRIGRILAEVAALGGSSVMPDTNLKARVRDLDRRLESLRILANGIRAAMQKASF